MLDEDRQSTWEVSGIHFLMLTLNSSSMVHLLHCQKHCSLLLVPHYYWLMIVQEVLLKNTSQNVDL